MNILSKNEKEILKLLLDNGRIADTEIAEKLKISPQACRKIRKKLEDEGVIEGYTCNLNFEKIGVNMFAIVLAKLKGDYWKEIGDIRAKEILKDVPLSIFSSLPSSSEMTYAAVYGFRDLKEMDQYSFIAKTKYTDYYELVHIYPFSCHSLVKDNPNQLFKTILDDKPITPVSFPK